MHLVPDEKSIPRIHLIGTLLIVLVLTLVLGGFFSWQSMVEHRLSLERVEQRATDQLKERLAAELDSAQQFVEFTRSRTEEVLRKDLTEKVDAVMQVVEAIYARESPRRPAAEVKKMIIEALRPVRFYDGRGYFFIDDMNGQFILLPTAPQMEGKTILDNQDDKGHFIMRGLIEAARKPRGEGFSSYRWYMPGNQKQMADKLAYVRHFAPYDWLIGTGDYTYKWDELLQQEAIVRLRTVRFGQGGYLALIDRKARVLISPSKPELEGKRIDEMEGLERQSAEKIYATGLNGGGFLQYEWLNPNTGKVDNKLALIKVIEPQGWIIFATAYDDELKTVIQEEMARRESGSHLRTINLLLASCGALLLGVIASLMFSRWSRRLFTEYHSRITAQQSILQEQSEELKRAEQHFRTLANGGTTLIWTSGLDKLCDYFNEPWLRFTGRSLEQEMGNGWTEGVHPDDFDRCLQTYVAAFDRRESFEMEYRLRSASGEYRWVIDMGNPRYDSAGAFLGYIGFCYDITERKQSEMQRQEGEKRYRNLYESMRDAFAMTDMNGRIVEFNSAFQELLGYDEAEVRQLTYPQITPARWHAFEESILQEQVLAHGSSNIYEKEYIRKDGAIIPVELRTYLLRDDARQPAGFWAIIRDISERKQTEIELAHHRQHLEELVAQRTEQLASAKEAAEAANIAKSTFLANMSHELRTPMNAIMGMTELALRKATDPKLRDQLSKVTRASQHLLQIINDILDLSKIESSHLKLEQIDFTLDKVLEHLMGLIGQKISDKGLKLHIDLPPGLPTMTLNGDPLHLGQILLNLTSNAVKFTEHGAITVRAQLLEERATDVLLRIEVQDTGIGIGPEDQQRLFTAFEQADGSITRKYGGTGLGLAISKRLVQTMGGEMGVESTKGQGSTFWFTVRFSKAAEVNAPLTSDDGKMAEEQLKSRFAGSRILLVEDEPINQEVSRELLEEMGLKVDLASDGIEAVELAQQYRYDLILMDMQMPNLNGVDATRAIRILSENINTPILSMTANAFNEDRQTCLNAGMNDHISKPVSPNKLYKALLHWLSHSCV